MISSTNKSKALIYSVRIKLKLLAILMPLLQLPAAVFSQQIDTTTARYDSATIQLYKSIRNTGGEEHRKNILEYKEDVLATKQDQILEEIRRLSLEAQNQLQAGVDTADLNRELAQVERWYRITCEGVLINPGTLHTHRNLRTSYRILRELLERTLEKKAELDNYYKTLAGLRNNIDSLYKDSALYKLSSDSTLLMRYVKNLVVIYDEIRPIDSAFKRIMMSLSELQTKVNRTVNRFNASLEKIESFQTELSKKSFRREASMLTDPARYVRPFTEITNFSLVKAKLALVFYTMNEIGTVFIMLMLVFMGTVFLTNLKQRLAWENPNNREKPVQPVLKYPLLSSIVVVFNIFQFALPDPPFVFNAVLWITSAIAATIIFRKYVTRFWMISWITIFVIFLFTCAENLILQAARPERWFMLGLSITGILALSTILLKGHRSELKDKMIIYFIGFVILMQILSAVANIYGLFNLSKTLLTSGYFNLVSAILFFWTVRLVNDTFKLSNQAYQTPGRKLFRINFNKLGSQAPPVFYVFLVVGWFILFAQNFYISKLLFDPIGVFLTRARTVGQFSFSLESLLEFFLILYLAVLTSKIVSFFASDSQTASRQSGFGSWLLLIRIAIITIGLLLAFAAVGIPMDRLTIILSALGVGVGFGLQSLVHSLVSGLIISFEKPISVGDSVEIDGKSGVVKSIGFRSSIISTGAGSDVVIPNGDLLNHHLLNWSHDNAARRVDIIIGVAHGTDLQKAISILKDLPEKDERILSYPSPTIVIKDFKTSSIDIQLSFWVGDMGELPFVKSDIILAMDSLFKDNDIQVATPIPAPA